MFWARSVWRRLRASLRITADSTVPHPGVHDCQRAARNDTPLRGFDKARGLLPEWKGIMTKTLERRMVALAEHLGRILGTIHGRAEIWRAPEALGRPIAVVRDDSVASAEPLRAAPATVANEPPAASSVSEREDGRGGGAETRGKKARKSLPTDPGAAPASGRTKRRAPARRLEAGPRRGRP